MKKGGKLKRVLLVSAAVLLVLFLAAGFIVADFMIELALNPRADKSVALEAEHNEVDLPVDYMTVYDMNRNWLDETGYFTRQIQSCDGLSLNAYLVENEDPQDTWVVICHGYNSWGLQLVGPAHNFYDSGYNILMPDARACGNSEGDYMGMGWTDRLDLLGWIDLINETYTPKNIVLYGVSMGGASVLMASGEPLPENVRAVVEDCGYTSAMDEFSYQLGAIFRLPKYPMMGFATLVARVKAGYWLGEANALSQVRKSVTPTLFIHGADDTFVPAAMLDALYDACGADKEMLVVEGAGHGGSFSTNEAMYWSTVYVFLEKYLV